MIMNVSRWIFCLLIFVSRGTTDLVCKHPAQANNADMKSCICVVKNVRGSSLPTVLNLCHLIIDYCHVIPNTKHTEPDKPIKIIRYYIVNLLRRIQYSEKKSTIMQNPICKYKLSNLVTANCPSNSMSCLASKVTYECSHYDKNSVCTSPLWNADPYGYSDSNWTIRQPSLNDLGERDLKTATAVIQMQGGPCYYCAPSASDHGPIAKDLGTVVGLFCDERITDEGHLVIQSGPKAGSPNVRFHLNTSFACYEFQPKQRCDFKSDVCKASKTFSCASADGYTFSFPTWANRSVLKVSTNVEYVFGFCADDVDCSTHDSRDVGRGVLICKKFIDGSRVRKAITIAYYEDIDKEVILRPNGFVWRISAANGKLEAVIRFQCDMSKSIYSKDFEMDVAPVGKPFLLSLRHRCFCPNPPAQCKERKEPTQQPPSGRLRKKDDILIGSLLGVGALFFIVVTILIWNLKHTPTENGSRNTTTSQQVGSSQPSTPSDSTPSNSTPSNSTSSWCTAYSSLTSFSSVFSRRSASPTSNDSRQQVRSADTTLDDITKPNEKTRLIFHENRTYGHD